MDDASDLELEPGDFLYQADQEIFLVLMEESDDSYLFSVHGWRDIDKERVAGYMERQDALYSQEVIDTLVDEEADESTRESYERLLKVFDNYRGEFEESGPHKDFSLVDYEE